jgi:hypothetical protein
MLPANGRQGAIRKSMLSGVDPTDGNRFSVKIMLHQIARAPIDSI